MDQRGIGERLSDLEETIQSSIIYLSFSTKKKISKNTAT